jgi:hypothetical protein
MDTPGGEHGAAQFPCAICGAPFVPGAAGRCQACGRFACRDCLKIHYRIDAQGRHIPTQTLCYECFHGRA